MTWRLLPLLCLGILVAGEAKPGPGNVDAGRKDALAAFARQAASAPKPEGDRPAIVGAWVWSGRADSNYRPFFEWNLRLRAGEAALAAVRLRLVTIGPRKEVLATAPWQDLGGLAARADRDVTVRLNCSEFPVYRVEVAWQGGEEAFLAVDKMQVPQTIAGLADQPLLVSADPNFEYVDRTRSAIVTWNLWNLGGKAATQVVQTLTFRDEQGKTVHTFEVRPEKGTLPGGYCKEQKSTVTGVPRFSTIGITTRQAEATGPDAGFSGAKEVELARLRLDGEGAKARLCARVRNGTGVAQEGVVVTVTLLDAAGKRLKAIDMAVGSIAIDEEREVGVPATGLPAWAAYDFAWKAAGP